MWSLSQQKVQVSIIYIHAFPFLIHLARQKGELYESREINIVTNKKQIIPYLQSFVVVPPLSVCIPESIIITKKLN